MDLIKSFRSFIFTTSKVKEKIRHVYIIPSLKLRRMKKSCTMYVSSLHYNTKGRGKVELFISHHFNINVEEKRKVQVCIYHHFIITRKDEEKLRYVYIITSL